MIRTLIGVVIFIIFLGCNSSKEEKPLVFKIPKLYNSQVLDSLGINRPGTILFDEFAIYVGTHHFSDKRIDVNPDSVISRNRQNNAKGLTFVSNYIDQLTLDSLKRNGRPSLIVDYNTE